MTKRRSLERPPRLGKTDAAVLDTILGLLSGPCRMPFACGGVDDPVCDMHHAARLVRKLRNRLEGRQEPAPDPEAARGDSHYLGTPLPAHALRAIMRVMSGGKAASGE